MKISLSNILFALLCVALLGVALGLGSVRGWSADRDEILNAFSADGELHTLLENRGMDAANLCVVAARHLPENDADLLALSATSGTLLSGVEDAQALLDADAVITDVALRFADSLPQLTSMQQSQRDMAYLTMLSGSLGRKSSLTHNYTAMVEDFNQQLTTSLSGKIAMLLGVDIIPVPGTAD
ncbi:MAG: hypothetical protein IJE07_01105 [Clostridia bacterium]|nr:hypothetical protein [Clostridia bacterium]